MERSKIKSRSHHDTVHLHPLTNVTIKYPFPTTYDFRDIAQIRFKGQGHFSKVKDQIKVTPWRCTPTPPN